MAMDFGKLNFAVGFNRTSAFPLDANSYFENYEEAVTAAEGAAVVGSSDSAYYTGQLIIVNEAEHFGLYQIGADKTLVKFGQASNADALAADIATLKAYFENGIAKKATADASGNIITDTYATKTEMNTAIQTAVSGAVQYLGVANKIADLKKPDSVGDFYRAGTAFDLPAASSQTGVVVKVHVGDLIICEDNNTPKWSIIHGEEIGVASISTEGSGISITGDATNPKIKLNAATSSTLGGVIIGDGLTVNAAGKLDSTAATQIAAAIQGLDVAATQLGAGETIKTISETDGKIAVVTQSISINRSQVSDLKDALDEKLNIADIDEALNDTSTNPVQNKAIYNQFGVVNGSIESINSDINNIEAHVQVLENSKVSKSTINGNIKIGSTETKVYELPSATANALGGIKTGYTGTAEKTYAVQLDDNKKAFVAVPWTDTKTTDTNQKITAKLNGSNVSFGNNDIVEILAGTNVTVTPNTTAKTITIAAQDTVYTHPAGSAANKTSGFYKFSTDANSHISSITAVTKEDITGLGIPGADTNTAHNHSAGVGLTGSGSAGISGTYTYKVNLVNEDKATNAASYTSGAANKFYAVQLDKNEKLGVYVPWEENTFRTIQVNTTNIAASAPVNFVNGTNISLAVAHLENSEKITINHTGPGAASQESTTATSTDGGTIAFGQEFYVPKFAIDANGHTRDLGRTKYKLPTPETYSLSIATTTTLGGVKSTKTGTTADRNYNVEVNSDGTMKVNVPWENTEYTLPIATTTVLGGIKAGNAENNFTANHEAEVEVNSSTGKASVDLHRIVNGGDLTWEMRNDETSYIKINQVSTDTLVQGTDKILVINGGGANW